MPNLNRTEMAAWRGFLDSHARLFTALDAELAKDDLSMGAYELLLALQQAGSGGVRMTQLANALRYSGGGLTRLVDRLEAQGYLERRPCPDDRRGAYAVLTAVGAGRLKRVHARHLSQVRARFLGPLSQAELETLAAIWRKLSRSDRT